MIGPAPRDPCYASFFEKIKGQIKNSNDWSERLALRTFSYSLFIEYKNAKIKTLMILVPAPRGA